MPPLPPLTHFMRAGETYTNPEESLLHQWYDREPLNNKAQEAPKGTDACAAPTNTFLSLHK